MAGALYVFTGPEAEVEANGYQVGNVVGSGVRVGSCHGNDGVHNLQGGGLFLSDGGIFEPVGLEFPREALVEPGVCLGVGRFSGFGSWEKLKTDKMDRHTHMQYFGVARTHDCHSLGQWLHRHLPVTYINYLYRT